MRLLHTLRYKGITFISPEGLNTSIGEHKASMVVYKGEESGNSYTEIYWHNDLTSREYTVEISLDLNDELNKDSKRLLFDTLEKNFGNN